MITFVNFLLIVSLYQFAGYLGIRQGKDRFVFCNDSSKFFHLVFSSTDDVVTEIFPMSDNLLRFFLIFIFFFVTVCKVNLKNRLKVRDSDDACENAKAAAPILALHVTSHARAQLDRLLRRFSYDRLLYAVR